MVVRLKKKVVISGATFGQLTVMGPYEKLFLCVCSCGKEVYANPEYLLNGMLTICDINDYDVFEHVKK